MMGNHVPRISVVMPVYNGERYLQEAIDSILAQTFGDFEFVIVDDGSRDSTLAILEEYASRDSRMHIISRPNTGIVGALNDGLAAANGEFIARMDADDVAHPDRFAKQIAFLDTHPKCVGVGSAFRMIDGDGDPIRVVPWTLDSNEIHVELLRGKGGLAHPTAMLRRNFVEMVGGYRLETQYAEDLDLWLRLSEHGQLANLPEVLLNYRMHAGSICANRARQIAAAVRRGVNDARARRGMAVDVSERSPLDSEPSSAYSLIDAPVRLIANALLGGYPQTARKHARRHLADSQNSPVAWGILLMTYLGPFATLIVYVAMRVRRSVRHGVLYNLSRKIRQAEYVGGKPKPVSWENADDTTRKHQVLEQSSQHERRAA